MKKVLVCPLDWGLGHATRCIPIIRELQKEGAGVSVASSGAALALLRQEFPGLSFFELPSYQPVYPAKGSMSLHMLMQLPRFGKVIRQEHAAAEKLVAENGIDIIISDNRYGCWSSAVKTVLVTHQPSVLMPRGLGWAAPIANSMIRRSVKKFSEVWIPDQEESGITGAFAGHLKNKKFIGWLSRFKVPGHRAKKYDLIGIVSGPEPQREIFEKLLTTQLTMSGLPSLLVAGLPGTTFRRQLGNLEVVNHLDAAGLEDAMAASDIVISRSGYSTIMDLIALGKKAIFIPTPQQPEQMYLGDYFKQKGVALAVPQDKFTLDTALPESKNYQGFSRYKQDGQALSAAIKGLLG